MSTRLIQMTPAVFQAMTGLLNAVPVGRGEAFSFTAKGCSYVVRQLTDMCCLQSEGAEVFFTHAAITGYWQDEGHTTLLVGGATRVAGAVELDKGEKL